MATATSRHRGEGRGSEAARVLPVPDGPGDRPEIRRGAAPDGAAALATAPDGAAALATAADVCPGDPMTRPADAMSGGFAALDGALADAGVPAVWGSVSSCTRYVFMEVDEQVVGLVRRLAESRGALTEATAAAALRDVMKAWGVRATVTQRIIGPSRIVQVDGLGDRAARELAAMVVYSFTSEQRAVHALRTALTAWWGRSAVESAARPPRVYLAEGWCCSSELPVLFWYDLLGALGGPAGEVAEPERVRANPAVLGDVSTLYELAEAVSCYLGATCGAQVGVAGKEPGRHSWEPAQLDIRVERRDARKLARCLTEGRARHLAATGRR
ncbi:hypothetical protein [Streptomyces tsukubensis]|uniref:Uncharacterized protein n=1 Tax=Streptomyces tsukubensis TaxID=83656 RepID=A0A1V4A5E2_9ACTN|nr:hypothetical protein [Streptomyces tsukubensis]OON75391.1 hypothetical protein B1H18_23215 [Streptomyces tsukubensis]QFR94977.1 hypothetical protein GBW32_20575 [Streptomyces tsukubensis]